MIANKVYTRDEMREEHIITTDYHFIDKEGEYFSKTDNESRSKQKYDAPFLSVKRRKKDYHAGILVAELSGLLRNR